LIAQYAGYQAAFLSLAAVATAALLIFWTLMPETKPAATGGRESGQSLLSHGGSRGERGQNMWKRIKRECRLRHALSRRGLDDMMREQGSAAS
jgi:hypothetical protein